MNAGAPQAATSEGLRARAWPRFVEGPDRQLLNDLYQPALAQAVRYDRCCAYFSSSVLAAAARGFGGMIERLIELGDDAPRPAIRLLVNEELDRDDVRALTETGDTAALEQALLARLTEPADALMRDRLGMLAWLADEGLLEMRVGVMRTGAGILHAKYGIIRDARGDELVFMGSGNESASALTANYEELEISTSWSDPERRDRYANRFELLWNDNHPEVKTLDLPAAVRQRLIQFRQEPERRPTREHGSAYSAGNWQRAAMLWRYIVEAPYLPDVGGAVCDATALVEPWPHQVRVVEETAAAWPAGRLLCDEVGLGKTIEAILILRRLLAGRGVRRVLILLPAGLMEQWQAELREKGGLVVPRFEKDQLVWPDERREPVDGLAGALEQDMVIVSRELARLEQNQSVLLASQPWDLVLLDEAHAARRREQEEGEYNSATLLLGLLRRLQLERQTNGILLLSATPMQTHPWEPWDLLAVLGVGGRWLADFNTVRRYYDAISELHAEPCSEDTAKRAAWVIDGDSEFPPMPSGNGRFNASEVAGRLQFNTSDERAALRGWLRDGSPLARRMHRNTRDTLIEYWEQGLLAERPPTRIVRDFQFNYRVAAERDAYEAIQRYIDRRYAELEGEKGGKGFVMTIYRRRAASSPYALRRSLERRAEGLTRVIRRHAPTLWVSYEELDAPWELEDLDEEWEGGRIPASFPDSPEVAQAELDEVEALLARLDALGDTDSKREHFYTVLQQLFDVERSVLVFTEYTDTMNYLRDSLATYYADGLACYSGSGGALWNGAAWVRVTKSQITEDLAAGRIRILLCTDAASEGLNLQAASALVNYDLPWNPAKVEQRIGRIDRIGQREATVHVINLFLHDSIDEAVYSRLRERCGIFERFVGAMQPVLALARRMLLGQEQIDLDLLDKLAREIEADALRQETYVEEGVTAPASSAAPLSRADIESALNALPEASFDVDRDEEAGLITIAGPDFPRRRFSLDGAALDRYPSTLPLTPLSPELRALADAVDRGGEHLPLIVNAHQAGPFRVVRMCWTGTDGPAVEIDSYAHLQQLIDDWDGTPPDPTSRLAIYKRIGAEAVRHVEELRLQAERRVEAGLTSQVEAARIRLLREVGRNLMIAGAKQHSMNNVWHQLTLRNDARAERMNRCYKRIGVWPEWTSYGYLLDEIRDFVSDLSDARRDTRDQLGSEIEAALNDPRWAACE